MASKYYLPAARASRLFYFTPALSALLLITPVGINILLFAKIIIQIWIFEGDSKRVRSIVMRVSSKRATENVSGK